MDEAVELGNYLPLSFKSPNEQEYIAFLWDAFETNYTHDKHQFAFLAYHMLTMSFVYFNIWQIRQARPEDFEKGLIGFGKDIEICHAYDITFHANHAQYAAISALHQGLRTTYSNSEAVTVAQG